MSGCTQSPTIHPPWIANNPATVAIVTMPSIHTSIVLPFLPLHLFVAHSRIPLKPISIQLLLSMRSLTSQLFVPLTRHPLPPSFQSHSSCRLLLLINSCTLPRQNSRSVFSKHWPSFGHSRCSRRREINQSTFSLTPVYTRR